jgi:hypothetical protein
MYVVGGTGIRAFTYVMLVGMFVGTYSSIAIAAPMVFKGHDEIIPGQRRVLQPTSTSTASTPPSDRRLPEPAK